MKKVFFNLSILLLFGLQGNHSYSQSPLHAPLYGYRIVKIFPHDTTSFTEGLVIDNNYLYESTGLYGQSKLLKIDMVSGKILKKHELDQKYFGEGMTILNNKIYQLTYQSHIGFIYDKNTFQLIDTFYYPSEGWGLTHDKKNLIMSNGSSHLVFLNPTTFRIAKQIIVKDNQQEISKLNELEYVKGKIYANVWPSFLIAIISPDNGKILGWIDISKLHPNNSFSNEPNGIAYDEKNHWFLVTGKNWPYIYAMKLEKPKALIESKHKKPPLNHPT